jgi:hypothetical protein
MKVILKVLLQQSYTYNFKIKNHVMKYKYFLLKRSSGIEL